MPDGTRVLRRDVLRAAAGVLGTAGVTGSAGSRRDVDGHSPEGGRYEPISGSAITSYLDERSRDRLWDAFSRSPDFDCVDVDSKGFGLQLNVYDGDELYAHVIGYPTGFDRDEQAYIAGNLEEIAAAYKDTPNRYGTEQVRVDEEQFVSDDVVEDAVVPAGAQEAVASALDDGSRNSLWNYFSSVPDFDIAAIDPMGDDAVQLRLEDRDAEKDGDQPAYVYALDDATGFDAAERAFLSNHLPTVAQLYRAKPALYLAEA